jgi:hypothetical protein
MEEPREGRERRFHRWGGSWRAASGEGVGGGSHAGTRGRIRWAWVTKELSYWQKYSTIAIFMVLPTFWSSIDLTSGSGVRDRADPN